MNISNIYPDAEYSGESVMLLGLFVFLDTLGTWHIGLLEIQGNLK